MCFISRKIRFIIAILILEIAISKKLISGYSVRIFNYLTASYKKQSLDS